MPIWVSLLLAINKSDRPALITPAAFAFPLAQVTISALEQKGLEELSGAVLGLLGVAEVADMGELVGLHAAAKCKY